MQVAQDRPLWHSTVEAETEWWWLFRWRTRLRVRVRICTILTAFLATSLKELSAIVDCTISLSMECSWPKKFNIRNSTVDEILSSFRTEILVRKAAVQKIFNIRLQRVDFLTVLQAQGPSFSCVEKYWKDKTFHESNLGIFGYCTIFPNLLLRLLF
jgi:hypothetical protein